MVLGHYDVPGKHAQLNGALPHCTGDYVGPIDSEDDVAPELLVHVESLIRRTGADIVQGAVQLMNLGRTWQEWYKVHNVEEYRAWYSSRMVSGRAGCPLGGNTGYTRATCCGWLADYQTAPPRTARRYGQLCAPSTAPRVVAAHSPQPRHPARKSRGHPSRRSDRCSGSGSAARTFRGRCRAAGWVPIRWGRLLAGYILAAPILQALSCALIAAAIFTALALKMPIALAMFMFAPLIPMALTIVSMCTGLRSFGRDYGQKIRIRHFASIVLLKLPGHLPWRYPVAVFKHYRATGLVQDR